jgi:hypothetical protein
MSFNKLKSTSVYGEFKVLDDPSGNQASVTFSRNLSVSGKITTSGLNSSSYITSQNLATPSTSLIPSTHGTFYSNGGSPFFSFNTGSVINSYVLATTSDLFSYLKITDATATYLSKTEAISTYLSISNAASIYQPISGMSSYIRSSANNTLTGTLTISNNLYLNGSLFYNGLDTSTQIVGLNNIILIPISSNTFFS